MAKPILIADPRYKAFVERYQGNPLAFAEEVCGLIASDDQVALFEAIESDTARVSVVSGTSTGKTNAFARIALWHMLCFPIATYEGKVEIGSNTFLLGPAVRTITDGIFKELSDARQAISQSIYPWLNQYWMPTATKAFVVGFASSWFIQVLAVEKGQSVGLAGKHRFWQLAICDEAGGIHDDAHDVIAGTSNQPGNRILMAGQGVKNAGRFYETHHNLRKENGGEWTALSFSSENSPVVSRGWLLAREQECGGRNSAEYMIRVRGLFSEDSSGNLLTRAEVEKAFEPRKIIQDCESFGYIITCDVSAGEYRDFSVCAVMRVSGNEDTGPDARRVEVVEIPVHTNSRDVNSFAGDVAAVYRQYEQATLMVDAGGIGTAVCQRLEAEGIPLVRINWGMQPFQKRYKERFFDLRAMASVRFRDAVKQGRFVMPQGIDQKLKQKILLQASRLPFSFTETGTLRYRVMSKEQMREEGIPSPDVVDALAFVMLESADYVPIGGSHSGDKAKAAVLDELSRYLEEVLAQGDAEAEA